MHAAAHPAYGDVCLIAPNTMRTALSAKVLYRTFTFGFVIQLFARVIGFSEVWATYTNCEISDVPAPLDEPVDPLELEPERYW